MFVVIGNKPYYVSADRNTVYPCSVSAGEITVYFSHGAKAPIKVSPIYTDTEIRARLGVHFEEKLDERTGETYMVSNKTVTSYRPKARSKNENSKADTEN